MICGGELVVVVGDATGSGGRNQEYVFGVGGAHRRSKNIVIGSADSEGSDGPTDTAGGIVDGCRHAPNRGCRSRPAGRVGQSQLFAVLDRLGDLIYTGIRGSNVRDLRLIYVGASCVDNILRFVRRIYMDPVHTFLQG